MNANKADTKVWMRGRLFVSRKTTSILRIFIKIIESIYDRCIG